MSRAAAVHWLPTRPVSWTVRGGHERVYLNLPPVDPACGQRSPDRFTAPDLVQVTCRGCLLRAASARYEDTQTPVAGLSRIWERANAAPKTASAPRSQRAASASRAAAKANVGLEPIREDNLDAHVEQIARSLREGDDHGIAIVLVHLLARVQRVEIVRSQIEKVARTADHAAREALAARCDLGALVATMADVYDAAPSGKPPKAAVPKRAPFSVRDGCVIVDGIPHLRGCGAIPVKRKGAGACTCGSTGVRGKPN